MNKVRFRSANDFGYFLNRTGFTLELPPTGSLHSWGFFWTVREYVYTASPLGPMTYLMPSGVKIQPDRHFLTDMGSIPPPLQAFPTMSTYRFLLPYIIHDSGCRYGGLFMRRPGEPEFTFVTMDRKVIDSLLQQMIRADGGNAIQAWLIYKGVRIGAWFKSKKSKKENDNGIHTS